jgi:hypothetical protein
LSSKAIGGWPRDFGPLSLFATHETDRLKIIRDIGDRLGLRETSSTISRLEIVPCLRITSRTMRRLKGALDCWVVPRLTMTPAGLYTQPFWDKSGGGSMRVHALGSQRSSAL